MRLQFDMSELGHSMRRMTPTFQRNKNGVPVDLGHVRCLQRSTFWKGKRSLVEASLGRSQSGHGKTNQAGIPVGDHCMLFSSTTSNSNRRLVSAFPATDSLMPMHNWGTSSVVDTSSSNIGRESGSLIGTNCKSTKGGICWI